MTDHEALPEKIATMGYKPSRFNAMRTIDGMLLLSNSFTGATVACDPEESLLVKRALRYVACGEPMSTATSLLLEQGFLVPEDRDEPAAIDALHRALNDTRSLELIIMPTEDCNFRCTYCYETFSKGTMLPMTRDRVKAFLKRNAPRLDYLRIAWFGGEPLLAYPVMVEIGEYARALCETLQVRFASSITTNGSLLDAEKLTFFHRTQCNHYQITLDGTQEAHDRTRPSKDGSGTFAAVWASLLLLKASPVQHDVLVRVNVHADNEDAVRQLTEQFNGAFGQDRRFTLDFHTIWDGGRSSDTGIQQLPDREASLQTLRAYALEKHARDCVGFNAFGPGSRYCYSGRSNSLVIGSDGTLYKCTLAFDDPRNVIGELQRDGEAVIDPVKFARWTSQSDYRSDAVCGTCFYVPSCMGAFCTFTRIVEGARPCPPEKIDLAATFRTAHAVYGAIGRSAEQSQGEHPS